jgi:arsenite-transporting ATPase
MYFCLYGLCIDGVVINRLLPSNVKDGFFKEWRELQARYVAEIEKFFAPVPVRSVGLCRGEVLGLEGLRQLGMELFGGEDPSRIFFRENPYRFVKKNGKMHLSMKLPFVMKGEVELHKTEDELIVRVGSFKKHVSLPRSFIRSQPAGARIEGDRLVVQFEGGS